MFEYSRAIARLPRTKIFHAVVDWINEAGSTSLDVRGSIGFPLGNPKMASPLWGGIFQIFLGDPEKVARGFISLIDQFIVDIKRLKTIAGTAGENAITGIVGWGAVAILTH